MYFPALTAGSCRQFNDLAKGSSSLVGGKRVEILKMLRFPIEELVTGTLLLRFSGICRRLN
jgi:hypothetical protein